MKFISQKIPGVFIIEPTPFADERGIFRRHFCAREFKEHGIVADISQCNVSENKFRHTLRGFHYQLSPAQEGKTLSCFAGSIYDIVVDLRSDSPAYLQWLSVELTGENRKSLHVPPGCANAFMTLQDNTVVYYYCSEFYTPAAERGIRYNDPLFNFRWPAAPKVISQKDAQHPDYRAETKDSLKSA